MIPSAKLGDALAAFSAIAEVRSRHEATADITAPTVRLGEKLQDSAGGGREPAGAARQRRHRSRACRGRSRAALRTPPCRRPARTAAPDLERRTNLSRVSLRIESGDASATSSEDDGAWGIGDALSDAGHILEIAAGIALIGLAILTPLALLCLLAWLAHRTWVRTGRERALD